jgi:hypothetical protein
MTADDMIDRGIALAAEANRLERGETRRELEQATAEAVLYVMQRLGHNTGPDADGCRAFDRLLYGLAHWRECRGIEEG